MTEKGEKEKMKKKRKEIKIVLKFGKLVNHVRLPSMKLIYQEFHTVLPYGS